MSTNKSKEKRVRLISEVGEIRRFISAASQDENTARLLTYLSNIEKDINGKKYGLVFEYHEEAIDTALENSIPVLTEQSDLCIEGRGTQNYLLEGDNLASLVVLNKTHRGKIKFIYIDPPYNTGNKDFVYDDSMVDNNDNFRHSKWLSFMWKRLKLARELLSDDGVMFISIDENEQSNLVLLCNQLFGEDNYVGNIIVRSNPRGSQSSSEIASLHEYLLLYTKRRCQAAIIGHKLNDDMIAEYKYSDERGKYRLLGLRQRGGFWRASERPNLYYPIFVDSETSNITLCEHGEAVYPIQPTSGEKGTWRWSKEKIGVQIDDLIAKHVSRNGELTWDIFQKDYLGFDNEIRRTKAKSIWDEKEMNYQNAANELKELFGSNVFSYAKPSFLIDRALEMIDIKSDDTILDFFAGSGTTGIAVMDKAQRENIGCSFILCTNNENDICQSVTRERIKRAIVAKNYSARLKYYKVDYVPSKDRICYEYEADLIDHVKELVELENGIDFAQDSHIAIILSEEELIAFFEDKDKCDKCDTIYLGHDVLPNDNHEKLIKEHNIKINIIPEYYYEELEG